MTDIDRRAFFKQAIIAGSALTSLNALAQAPAKVAESDPQAVALGYKHDTKLADGKKYPKHDASQACHNCQLFQGKPDDEWGGCAIFPGKQVSGHGWCSAWIKKPG
jgi:hypothetical protein